ncbi:MAG: hypothetical protein Crog4KO_07580 [Crocinitomicaceae bacterium]
MKSFIYCMLLLTIICGAESCSVHKRRYRPGWYISTNWNKSNPSTSANQSESNKESSLGNDKKWRQAKHVQETADVASGKEDIDNDSSSLIPKISDRQNFERSELESSKDEQFHLAQKENLPVVLNDYGGRDTVIEEKESKFWSRFLGGFLGVLLALVALAPIFLFALVFNNGELEDKIFYSSSKDSTFTTAFKSAFNAAMKIGFVVLWIALILLFFAALFYLGYSVAGILGGILAVLIFIGFLVLLAYLLGNFIDMILPNY